MAEKKTTKKCSGACNTMISKESPVLIDVFHGSQKAIKEYVDKFKVGKEIVSIEFSKPNLNNSYIMIIKYKLVV